MSGYKLILALVCWISLLLVGGGIMVGLMFSGDPGSCGTVEIDETEVLPVLNKINRLIAGEINRIELTDNELIAAFRERLDPRVKDFRICLEENRVGVSGQTTNRIGLTIRFNISAQVGFEKNYPQISQLELAVGRVSWPAGYIQKLVNQRLAKFNFGRKFKVDIDPGLVTLEGYGAD